METTKKDVSSTSQAVKPTLAKTDIIEFFGGIKHEFKNIAWTSKKELALLTKVVVSATFLFGFFIYAVDLVIQGVLKTLAWLVSLF